MPNSTASCKLGDNHCRTYFTSGSSLGLISDLGTHDGLPPWPHGFVASTPPQTCFHFALFPKRTLSCYHNHAHHLMHGPCMPEV